MRRAFVLAVTIALIVLLSVAAAGGKKGSGSGGGGYLGRNSQVTSSA